MVAVWERQIVVTIADCPHLPKYTVTGGKESAVDRGGQRRNCCRNCEQ